MRMYEVTINGKTGPVKIRVQAPNREFAAAAALLRIEGSVVAVRVIPQKGLGQNPLVTDPHNHVRLILGPDPRNGEEVEYPGENKVDPILWHDLGNLLRGKP